MTGKNVYSTHKVNYHPQLVDAFKCQKSHHLNPIQVHLMPQNVCNQDCVFCSYRLSNWKNSEIFDTSKHIPWEKMEEILEDLYEMGTKAIEVTGGGEPLAYPHIDKLLERLASFGFEVGLVTNGTLLTEKRADLLFNTKLKWVRVSIDSGTPSTYAAVRRVRESHWEKAWAGIKRLVDRRQDQVIGIGYVVTPENHHEIYQGAENALEADVDNMRVSMAFTPAGDHLLNDEQVKHVMYQLNLFKADYKDHETRFVLADLFEERLNNMKMSPVQDYDYCGTKDVLCVIEGECNVYTCCTLTGAPSGLIGSISGDKRFAELWAEKAEWRQRFNVRARCKCACLYEKRNHAMLDLMNPPDHLNFI